MFPYIRPRRLRKNKSIRDLVRETRLHPDDFIVPLFIIEGHSKKEEIASMPGYFRMTLDHIQNEVKELLFHIGQKEIQPEDIKLTCSLMCCRLLTIFIILFLNCKKLYQNY